MKVWQLLSDESKWVKGLYACDALGDGIGPESPLAVKWCLNGAILCCYPETPLRDEVYGRLLERLDTPISSQWNDRDSRTFAEVYALVKDLDI